MAKYYYNGVLLPEIPADKFAAYPNQMILKWPNGNIQLIGSKNGLYFNGSTTVYDKSNATLLAYYLSEDTWVEDANQSGKYTGWTIMSNGVSTLQWSNHNIPSGSATATDIYFRGSFPTVTPIHLVNQNQSSSNGVTSCSLTMTGCTIGNTLIFAYAVRGDGNDPTLTDGLVKLGGGNNVSDVGDSDQRLYFAYKVATAETETVTITQNPTSRIYMVCSEYSGVSSVLMRNDLASFGSSNYTVTGSKSETDDVMVYGVTSAYYSNQGGRLQTITPTDIVKIEGDSSAERLACWFDGGLGAVDHTFVSSTGTSNNPDAVLECVQLFYEEPEFIRTSGYLIQSGDSLFTVTDGVLTAVDGSVNAELFKVYGIDNIPDGALLATLTDPEVLYWQDSTDELPTLSMTVNGTPPLPQVFTSEPMDLTHESIAGISHAAVDASEDVRFAISFDDGASWKAFDGVVWFDVSDTAPGMLPSTMNAITAEQWAEVVVLDSYMVRFWLPNVTAYVKSVVMHYINP